MKVPNTPSAKFANWLIIAVLCAVPFHAFLTVWGSTLLGHYTLLRLWDDTLLSVLVTVCAWWLVRDAEMRSWLAESLLARLVVAYAGLTLLLGAVSLARGDVSARALAYGVLVNLRFLLWFLAVLLAARCAPLLIGHWRRLLLVPAAVVIVFAALQYTVLPHDFLSHFGYHTAITIAPIETINHNDSYIRVQSTLRGANPLGAYLVIVLAALALLAWRDTARRLLWIGFGAAGLLALYASGSRSAWIGAALAGAILAWRLAKTRQGRMITGVAGLAILALSAGAYLVLRHNTTVQNALLHTQDHSTVTTSSNSAHVSALMGGVREVLHQPLGDGPGTAGPASTYNTKQPARVAEDYYVQVAQETGWLGLALLLSIFALVALELWQRSKSSGLALVLFAAFIGLAFVNLLSHAWADDTLAFVWWGFAAIALAQMPKPKQGRE
ncbi:MAG TPA: O-antigen ligase family protein [Candidatus Saccharimonadales bacterium]|nr:O-antigen ligase family protein [Candidatus Saccharimonadales bacterium]